MDYKFGTKNYLLIFYNIQFFIKNKARYFKTTIRPILILTLISLFYSSFSFANRLEESLQKGQHKLITFGQIVSIIGVILGGFLMRLGVWDTGKKVLISSFIGLICAFCAPEIVETIRSIFN